MGPVMSGSQLVSHEVESPTSGLAQVGVVQVSEWLNKRLAKLCRSTEEHPVAHLTILANQ